MKRLVYKILLLATLVIISYSLLLYLSIVLVKRNPNDYIAAIIEKDMLLKKTRSPKIIFIGGSNIAFGLDSEKIHNTFGMSVVNMGLYANFGLNFMLQSSMPYINSNDIVVLSPEYEHFYGEFSYGKKELMDLLCYYPEGSKYIKMTIRQIKAILISNSSRIRLVNLHSNLNNEIYSRNGFNKYGDMVSYLKLNPILPLREANIQSTEFNESLLCELNKFVKYVNGRQARFIFLFPSITITKYNKEKTLIDTVYGRLKDNKLISISSPQDHIYSDKYFYNTNYHLNSIGRQIRTDRVVNDMINQLKLVKLQ